MHIKLYTYPVESTGFSCSYSCYCFLLAPRIVDVELIALCEYRRTLDVQRV